VCRSRRRGSNLAREPSTFLWVMVYTLRLWVMVYTLRKRGEAT
jgi:hypothetical protein